MTMDEKMDEKKWYASKTLWVNVLAVVAIVAQGITGKQILSLEMQGVILGGINMVLRLVTKSEIAW